MACFYCFFFGNTTIDYLFLKRFKDSYIFIKLVFDIIVDDNKKKVDHITVRREQIRIYKVR